MTLRAWFSSLILCSSHYPQYSHDYGFQDMYSWLGVNLLNQSRQLSTVACPASQTIRPHDFRRNERTQSQTPTHAHRHTRTHSHPYTWRKYWKMADYRSDAILFGGPADLFANALLTLLLHRFCLIVFTLFTIIATVTVLLSAPHIIVQ